MQKVGFSGAWRPCAPPCCTALLLAALLSASRPCPTWTRLGPDFPSGLPTSLLCRAAPPRTPCSLMPLSVSLCSRGPPDGPADLPHLLSLKPPSACCVPGTGGRASWPTAASGHTWCTDARRWHSGKCGDPRQWAAGHGWAERDRKWRGGVGWAGWQREGAAGPRSTEGSGRAQPPRLLRGSYVRHRTPVPPASREAGAVRRARGPARQAQPLALMSDAHPLSRLAPAAGGVLLAGLPEAHSGYSWPRPGPAQGPFSGPVQGREQGLGAEG